MTSNVTARSRRFDQPELRRMLVKSFKTHQPDFRFLTFATGAYYFQRIRDFYDLDLKELVHIVYDFEKQTMHCSVSSRLNPVYTMSPVYSDGIVNAHVDLVGIKHGYGIYPTDETVYRCDGTIEGARVMVEEMVTDFKSTGLSFLDQRLQELWSNHVVRKGIDIIDGWEYDKTMLKNELIKHMRTAKNNPARLKHPMVNAFREQLMAVPNTPASLRSKIPVLTFELLELYCNNRIAP
jgi:hypothetical protein